VRTAVALPLIAVAAIAASAPGATAQTPLATPKITAVVQFVTPGASTTFTRFELRGVPEGATVVVRCLTKSGERCGGKLRRAFKKEDASGTVAVKRFLDRKIKAGRRLEAEISHPSYFTKFKTLSVRRDRRPTITTECAEPGSEERTDC